MRITRKINWVSAIDSKNNEKLEGLENALASFYNNSEIYYDENEITSEFWTCNDLYLDIVEEAKKAHNICEIGCGKSNILKYYPDLIPKYSGSDFSKDLLEENNKTYVGANYQRLENSKQFPFESQQFDLVFSVFVLEHVVFPQYFLDECTRILKQGGTLIIICPDYLGKNRLTSQRIGLSSSNLKEKLRRFHFIDAFLHILDSRFIIPNKCKQFIRKYTKPRFLINIQPTIFEDSFVPDCDAVYVTYKTEIVDYLKDRMTEFKTNSNLDSQSSKRRWLYIKFQKS